MSLDLEIKVARVIDPVTMRKYDDAVAQGRVAQNGRPWADVAYGTDRDIAIQHARAVIAAVRSHDHKE